MSDADYSIPNSLIVDSFGELTTRSFYGDINAFCWKRDLANCDFQEIVEKLSLYDTVTEITTDELINLNLTEKGTLARNIILSDLKTLNDFGAQPTLNLLKNYNRDTEFDFISTDVYSWHVDRSPVLIDTYLCTYYGASSDIIPSEYTTQKIQIPEVREQLLELYDGDENYFEEFLKENFFDLHYKAQNDSKIINLGNGHLWRLAVDHPQQPVTPCVHRAPKENPNELRLMLIC